MLSQEKLLKVIPEDLRVCRGATHAWDSTTQSLDVHERETQNRSDGMFDLSKAFRNNWAIPEAPNRRGTPTAVG